MKQKYIIYLVNQDTWGVLEVNSLTGGHVLFQSAGVSQADLRATQDGQSPS